MSREGVNESVEFAIELMKSVDGVFIEATHKIAELFLKRIEEWKEELALVMFKINGELSVLVEEADKMVAKAVLGDRYIDPLKAGEECKESPHVALPEEKIAFVKLDNGRCGLIYRDHHSGEIEYVEF
jgi:hypothetical protein